MPTASPAPRTDPREVLTALALELHAIVAEVEGGILHRQAPRLAVQVARAVEVGQGLRAVAPRLSEVQARLAETAAEGLDALVPELSRPSPRWRALRQRWSEVVQAYEALRAEVRRLMPVASADRLGTVKPLNLRRNLFHVAMGVTGVTLYQWFLDQQAVLALGGSVLALFVGLDLARRFSPRLNQHLVQRILGGISRPGEAHRVPSSTWYLVGLLVGVVLFPKHAVALGTLVLAVGDPAASILGKLWGRRKLVGQKSLAGSLGFVAVAWAAGAGYLALVQPSLGTWAILAVSGAAAVAGAVAELASHRLDDNLTVPLLASAVAGLLL